MPRLLSIPKDLDRHQRRLLILLGAAFFIGNYDLTILTLALPDVQASFGVAEENLGNMIAIIRLGAIPGLLLALMAVFCAGSGLAEVPRSYDPDPREVHFSKITMLS